MKMSPIALFTYNRPEHTHNTIQSLLQNSLAKDSDIFIFSDESKNQQDKVSVKKVRELIKKTNGFKSMEIIERTENFGLAKNITSGVTEILNIHNSAIILEDDLITAPNFLYFMNSALEYYEDDDRVASIHGYTPPLKKALPNHFFLQGADCWGWATWSRAWKLFNYNGAELLKRIEEQSLMKQFDFDGAYPFTKMLANQIAKKNDSWAIRWHASIFLEKKLTLYPKYSLVHNIGNDGSGNHSKKSTNFYTDIGMANSNRIQFDEIPIEHSAEAFNEFKKFFKLTTNKKWKFFIFLKNFIVKEKI
jgi:Glycosyl transferase family 2